MISLSYLGTQKTYITQFLNNCCFNVNQTILICLSFLPSFTLSIQCPNHFLNRDMVFEGIIEQSSHHIHTALTSESSTWSMKQMVILFICSRTPCAYVFVRIAFHNLQCGVLVSNLSNVTPMGQMNLRIYVLKIIRERKHTISLQKQQYHEICHG